MKNCEGNSLSVIRSFLFCFIFSTGVFAGAQESAGSVSDWSTLIDRLAADSTLEQEVQTLIEEAEAEVKKGIVQRAHTLDEVGKNRTWLDGRANVLEDEIRETFALAMSDYAACNLLARTLPMIAAAWRLTGNEEFKAHLVAQLEEASGWSPLQRPGWTLYKPGNRLPADGKDGNWLATGCGVRAIVTTLDIMGDDVDSALREELQGLLETEIESIVDDWESKRPWFVRSNNAVTNQWVLPTEGLVRACLHLGIDKHREAYELGVKNLLQALSVHGKHGEFEEGIGYANFTLTSMLHAARAMAVEGDRRAVDHPFLARFPTWAVHHIQPGRMTVNCFDAGNAKIARDNAHWRSLLALLVFAEQSEVANWALWEQFDGPTNELIGLLSRMVSRKIERIPPPLFAAYERAPMVVWRDSWRDDATGVWVRGGHELDQHDHQDRGHVNFIARGKPILIEAGTPSYSNPDMGVHYASGAGHNVLQIGTFFPERPYPPQSRADYDGWQKAGGIAPITVHRLDGDGGSVWVEAGDCYEATEKWLRHVEWHTEELIVRDEVVLKSDREEVVLFRWHLGTDVNLDIVRDAEEIAAEWTDARLCFRADRPVEVRQYKAPDSTVTSQQDHMHTCLEVTTREKENRLSAVTRIEIR